MSQHLGREKIALPHPKRMLLSKSFIFEVPQNEHGSIYIYIYLYAYCVYTYYMDIIDIMLKFEHVLSAKYAVTIRHPWLLNPKNLSSKLLWKCSSHKMALHGNNLGFKAPKRHNVQIADRRSQRSVPNLGVLVSNPQGLDAGVKCSSEHLHANLGWQKGSSRIQVGTSEVEDCCHMCNIS